MKKNRYDLNDSSVAFNIGGVDLKLKDEAHAKVMQIFQGADSITPIELYDRVYPKCRASHSYRIWRNGFEIVKALNSSVQELNDDIDHNIIAYDLDQRGYVIDMNGEVALRNAQSTFVEEDIVDIGKEDRMLRPNFEEA